MKATVVKLTGQPANKRSSMNEKIWRKGLQAVGHAAIEQEIIDLAIDLVALWEHPKIKALDRHERNAAIGDVRLRLIEAVNRLG